MRSPRECRESRSGFIRSLIEGIWRNVCESLNISEEEMIERVEGFGPAGSLGRAHRHCRRRRISVQFGLVLDDW